MTQPRLGARLLGCWAPSYELQAFRLSGFQAFRLSGFQAFRLSGFQAFRLSGFQAFGPRLVSNKFESRRPPVRPPGIVYTLETLHCGTSYSAITTTQRG
jgi:hypothetical protein